MGVPQFKFLKDLNTEPPMRSGYSTITPAVVHNLARSVLNVYAFGGWGEATAVSEARRARLGRRRYRARFGIETSYRQKNQARGWTTSTSAEYRLLLEGIALVLRQVWVCLTQRIAKA